MTHERKRVVEIRLLVLVRVNIAHDDLIEHIGRASGTAVADIVKAEVASNLESVPYVESATVSQL